MNLYRLYDPDTSKGCFKVNSWDESKDWNEKKWGIFWTVNDFDGDRKKENLKKITRWAVDIDEGTKESQAKNISKFILPSMVIETKRGYQVYYDAIDAKEENYQAIVLDRLVYHLKGDHKARDVCRILRAPYYFHWKNPEDPYLVAVAHEHKVAYTEAQMMKFFPLPKQIEKQSEQKQEIRKAIQFEKDDSLWERIWSMNCKDALERLSGHACVGSERFTFKRTTNDKMNIFVDNKSTSCWIDNEGRIGSLDKGGPTILQWINWYQQDYKRSVKAMRDVFPEIFK